LQFKLKERHNYSGNIRHTAYSQSLYAMLKEPTAQTAHLVFADTQANAEKTKELYFCQCSTEKYRN